MSTTERVRRGMLGAMRKPVVIAAAALGYVGLFLLVGFLFGWFEIDPALRVAVGPIAAVLAGPLLLNADGAKAGDAALGALAGGALLYAMGMRDRDLMVSIAASAPLAFVGATMLAWTPLARWRALGACMLANAISVGVAFCVLFLTINRIDPVMALMVCVAAGVCGGGFLAQLVIRERRILLCGSGVIAFFAVGLLLRLNLGFLAPFLICFAPAGLVGSWLAWALRQGPNEPVAM
jgi:hypothetical protein